LHRPLIRAIVDVMQPKPGDTVMDPSAGTGGFLLAAYEYITRHHARGMDAEEKRFLTLKALRGVEIVDATARLCAMNLFLHGIGGGDRPPIKVADSLASKDSSNYDMVLTNPPFGKKSSVTIVNEDGDESRETLTVFRDDFWATTSNKQLNFVQHIVSLLKINRRAAVVVPDNVLFEGGAGETIRRRLLESCDVHTLLRLPTGLFYAQGVKANVIFFDRKPASPTAWTKELWIYDLRTNKHFTLKTRPLNRADLDDFVAGYHPANRYERKESERFHRFAYEDLLKRDKLSLDIAWLRDESLEDTDNLPDPAILAQEIVEDLQAALDQFAQIAADLANPARGAES
jgi:type I restriction enzyme M protein